VSEFLANLAAAPAEYMNVFMFYTLAAVLLFAATMVISARNPVHAVLFLILAFFNAAGLFLLMGAEFIAMILVIVYVGAVAVLFLFVVMMLDIDLREAKRDLLKHLPLGLVAGFILFIEIFMLVIGWLWAPSALINRAEPINTANNTLMIGNSLYTHYLVPFQISGLILLVAMIGAIVLTHRERPGVRRQSIVGQVQRSPSSVLKINKVASGEGVQDDANRA
jgi:NADH-quinone oxidoreductase subunit J